MMRELVRYWHGMVCGPARMAVGLMCGHTDYWYAEFATQSLYTVYATATCYCGIKRCYAG